VALPEGRSLVLTGLDLATSRRADPGELYRVLDGAPEGKLRIVLAHAPDFVEHLPGKGVDLALAGHTHGGQVKLPGIGPPITSTRLPQRFAGGLHYYAGVPIEVSRGIGMERHTAPQIRFFCPPEICVLNLRY
jgi:predicted MPP superfamily phosphohydrolase